MLKHKFKIYNPKDLLLRGFFGAVAMTFFYLSIQHTGAGRASLLSNTYPVFVAIFGAIFFGEVFKLKHAISLMISILGVFLVFYDKAHYDFLGNLFGILSAVSAGFAVHFIKRARAGNSVFTIYLSACLFGLLICFPAAHEAVHITFGMPLIFLLCVAVFAFLGQIVMAYGYGFVSASKGSLLGLMEVPFTILLGVLLLGEKLGPLFIVGGVLILIGLALNHISVVPRKEES
jgi:drug/metabolite transporter (DMT)-like permease